MRNILLFLVLFSVSPAWATWTLVQQKAGQGAGTTNQCPITLTTPTVAGNKLIIGDSVGNATAVTISSVTGGTFTPCGPSCQTGNSTAGWTDGGTILSATGGDSTITITNSASTNTPTCFISEWSDTVTVAFDIGGALLDSVNCTSCASPTLAITGTNDAIFSWSSCGQACSGAITGWGTVYSASTGDGSATKANVNSGASFNWNQSPTGQLATASIALKEVGSNAGNIFNTGKFLYGGKFITK